VHHIEQHAGQSRGEELLLSFEILRAPDAGADRVLENLFTEHYARLVKTLVRLTGDFGTAEEVASEAFCRLHQRRGGLAGGNPAGWLYRTAMNLGLDALRANSRRARREELAGQEALRSEGQSGPLHDLLAEEQRARVRRVIAQLKPVQGQVLVMGSSGFSPKEIAAVLGVKPDSVYMLIAREDAV
jgi:RNA polymerase sigma-70 factor (ECF subfamily)